MISLEKWKILTPIQKLLKNVGDLGKIIVATGFKNFAQSAINRQIWSHWLESRSREESKSEKSRQRKVDRKKEQQRHMEREKAESVCERESKTRKERKH